MTRERGRFVPFALAPHALATVHPSALLRAPDEETRRREILRFIEDLRQVAELSEMTPDGCEKPVKPTQI